MVAADFFGRFFGGTVADVLDSPGPSRVLEDEDAFGLFALGLKVLGSGGVVSSVVLPWESKEHLRREPNET